MADRDISQRLADRVRLFEIKPLSEIEALRAEVARLTERAEKAERALALVQRHHATAWNRGHTAGMAAQADTARRALEAVKADAWGNTQLTEALMAAEARAERAEAEAAALRADARIARYAAVSVQVDIEPYTEYRDDMRQVSMWEVQIKYRTRATADAMYRAIDAARAREAER